MLNVKDLDKEVVLRLRDKDFIKVSFLNRYLYNIYKEDRYLLFKIRLQKYYPDTIRLRYEYGYGTWREYYLMVRKTIRELQERYLFEYKFGNPFKQVAILTNIGNTKIASRKISILYYGIVRNEISLVKYAIETGDISISKYDILDAASLNDPEILKYLIAQGVDVSFISQYYWHSISEECREFLKEK